MTPDPKAAEDFATLVLVTARAVRHLLDPMRPKTRGRLLCELEAALAPFDAEDESPAPKSLLDGAYDKFTAARAARWREHAPGCPVVTDLCGNAECSCGAWDAAAQINPRDDNCELPKTPEPS